MPGTIKIDSQLLKVALETKGFMPLDEGDALFNAACLACKTLPSLPIVEVGSYCGRSTVWLGAAAQRCGSTLFTVDHHYGSEENQQGWEWFDESLFDTKTKKLNSLPTLLTTLRKIKLGNVVIPVVGESRLVGARWRGKLAMCFIDGGHGDEPSKVDYLTWARKIELNGLLVIHDVFADPNDGGQAPYRNIYCAALASGEFVEVSATGSLRVLQRIESPVN